MNARLEIRFSKVTGSLIGKRGNLKNMKIINFEIRSSTIKTEFSFVLISLFNGPLGDFDFLFSYCRVEHSNQFENKTDDVVVPLYVVGCNYFPPF